MSEMQWDDDEGTAYTPGKPKCNEDFVRDLMNYSPVGALAQAFIMEAIQRYARECAAADPAKFDSGLMSGAAWVKCAQDIKAKCDAFYGRHDTPTASPRLDGKNSYK